MLTNRRDHRPDENQSPAWDEIESPPAQAPGATQDTTLVTALGELTAAMLATSSLDDLLTTIARLAARAAQPGVSCGITVQRGAHPVTAGASDSLATSADELQYAHGDGPCLQALRTGLTVEMQDASAEERWGEFPRRAFEKGVRSSLSLPLTVNSDTPGALNLYSQSSSAVFDADARRAAEQFAAQAAGMLTLARRQVRASEMSAQLRDALAARAIIDQACGIVMARQQCDADEAFQTLRRASMDRNIKIRDIAAAIVTQTTGRAPTSPARFQEPD